MFKKLNAKRLILASLLVMSASVLFAAQSTYYRREHTAPDGQIWILEKGTKAGRVTQKGNLQFGDNEDTPSLPTYSNTDKFGVKVPFSNQTGAATVRGQILIGSATATGMLSVHTSSDVALTNVFGCADGAYSSGSVGWMTVSGLGLCLTTGTVNIGNVLITTNTPTGYGVISFSTVTWLSPGSGFAVAVGTGNTAGGLTPVLFKR